MMEKQRRLRMMKKVFVFTLSLFAYSTLFAQNDEQKKSVFQLSFFPPLSTNGLNSPQYTNQVSFNILAGISRNEGVLTFGGLSNMILNDAKGVQFAGLYNHIGNEGQGLQFAGIVNFNKSRFTGLQLGGLLNTASEMNGFQCSGLANIAKDVNGLQFAGLINIAKQVKGVQLTGLINIAESSDCPIGLINIIRKGEKSIAVTYDAIGSSVVSFRSGGTYTYGILGIGYNHKTKHNSLVTEGGLGAHIPVASWFRINNEIKFSSIGQGSKPTFQTGYSLIPAFKIGKHIELFAGAGIQYMESKQTDNDRLFPNHSIWKKHRSTKLQQLYIGYQLGIQYIFR